MHRARPLVLAALAALVSACALPAVVPAVPPAVAPPATGAALPALDLDAPGRGADQLAAWARDRAAVLDVPASALEAYGWAAASVARSAPGCGIGWTTLAGIGSVETGHGRFGGSRLDRDNRAQPPIRGAALDGRPGVAEIRDTDGGALDGDTTFDRAMGPMQFIPGTWEQWGVDADGDGVADPDDLDDAALAAARYLCASGGDLTAAGGWNRAVLTYNRSSSYVREVLERSASYAAGRSA
ncbi:lytic murein transglycosylase [Rhodococcus antarcticus]|uniref:lytic murein transglycosylase n=1 Tax=Rhodococcus antarcticus TaxID=2987751 RepID=UPI003F494DD0